MQDAKENGAQGGRCGNLVELISPPVPAHYIENVGKDELLNIVVELKQPAAASK